MSEQVGTEHGAEMSSRIRRAAGYERDPEPPADPADGAAGGQAADFDGGVRGGPVRGPVDMSDLIRRAAGF